MFSLPDLFHSLMELRVKLKPVGKVSIPPDPKQTSSTEETWGDSLTKLRIFQLTEYERIVYFDCDALVLKNMDVLFRLPSAPVAMPRAYWANQGTFTSMLLVIEPSERRFHQLVSLAQRTRQFDMDVLNSVFAGSCLVLPNVFALLTGIFRDARYREMYLGNVFETWAARDIYDRAYLVHFSDFPVLPKPWVSVSTEEVEAAAPNCPPDCVEKEVWIDIYQQFEDGIQSCRFF